MYTVTLFDSYSSANKTVLERFVRETFHDAFGLASKLKAGPEHPDAYAYVKGPEPGLCITVLKHPDLDAASDE